MSFISSFDITGVVVLFSKTETKGRLPEPKIFLCIHASAHDAAAINPNGIKTL